MWQGTLPFVFGIVFSAGSAAVLLYIFIENARLSLRLQRAMEKYKAKWVGAVAIVSGLSTTLSRDSILLLNRRDELIIDGPYRSIIIPLETIERIAVLYGENFLRNSDYELAKKLELAMKPNFSFIRAYLNRNPQAKRQRFIMIKPFSTSEEIEHSDMIVLVEGSALSNLRALLNRPEINDVARVLNMRNNKKNKAAMETEKLIHLSEKENVQRQSVTKKNIPIQKTTAPRDNVESKTGDKGVNNNGNQS